MKKTMLFFMVLVSLVIVVWYRKTTTSSQWTEALHVIFMDAGESSLEYGWQRDQIGGYSGVWKIYSYKGYLLWQHNGETRKYFVAEEKIKQNYTELWVSPKNHGIFLIQQNSGVICSLDLQSGEFIDKYGMIVDWHLSTSQQEQLPRPTLDNTTDYQVKQYPKWAVRKGNILIARTY